MKQLQNRSHRRNLSDGWIIIESDSNCEDEKDEMDSRKIPNEDLKRAVNSFTVSSLFDLKYLNQNKTQIKQEFLNKYIANCKTQQKRNSGFFRNQLIKKASEFGFKSSSYQENQEATDQKVLQQMNRNQVKRELRAQTKFSQTGNCLNFTSAENLRRDQAQQEKYIKQKNQQSKLKRQLNEEIRYESEKQHQYDQINKEGLSLESVNEKTQGNNAIAELRCKIHIYEKKQLTLFQKIKKQFSQIETQFYVTIFLVAVYTTFHFLRMKDF